MSIVLAIFGVVFNILLFLLLSVLIILLIILFMPVRYNVSLNYIDEKLVYNIKIHWLFRLVFVNMIRSDSGEETIFRIAWKRFLVDNSDDKEKPTGSSEENVVGKPIEPENTLDDKSEKSSEAKKKKKGIKENGEEKEEKNDKEKNDKEKSGIFSGIKGIYDSYKEFKGLDISVPLIIKELITLLRRMFKALRPKKFNLDLEIGQETPDVTGITLGAIYVFMTFIDTGVYDISVRGNYEKSVINLTSHIKGKIILFLGLLPFIRFCFSKALKPIRKILLDKLFKRKKHKGEK